MPPYSCVVETISSPGCRSSERATAFNAGRRVRDEHEVGRRRADVCGEPLAGRADQLRKAALEAEKLDRIPLELELKALVLREHRPWAGAERPVVEEDDLGIEQKELTHVNIA